MFESPFARSAQEEPIPAQLASAITWLAHLSASADDAERIERVALLERIKAATAAAQVRETAAFARSQVEHQRSMGVPSARLGRGVAEQVALARRISPVAGARQVTLAKALTEDLPATLGRLTTGAVSERTATVVARETSTLDRRDRRRVDADLADDLPSQSTRQAEAAARRLSYETDPESPLRRGRRARTDRHVSVRPAPDTMAILSAFVPAEQGIACWANLDAHARSLKSTGDTRSLGQIMSDTLVQRLTGQDGPPAIPVEIGLTMSRDALLDADDVPAMLDRYGPLPAEIGREIATHDADRARTYLRRLFTDPHDDTVTGVDPRRRRFDGALARLIRHRDQQCRDPYCDAPIRHLDHRTPYHRGGPTSADNGEGRCVRGNQVKEMPGWSVRDDGCGSTVTTPIGHTYRSSVPAALGAGSDETVLHRRRVARRLEFLARERMINALPPSRPELTRRRA